MFYSVEFVLDPFQNLLAPALFDSFREKTRSISNARFPSAGARAELWKGSMLSEAGAPLRQVRGRRRLSPSELAC
jgi:hypothetical protein